MNVFLFVVIVIVALVIAALVLFKPGGLRGQPGTMGGGYQSGRVQELRRSLMTKAMGDASRVDAWLD